MTSGETTAHESKAPEYAMAPGLSLAMVQVLCVCAQTGGTIAVARLVNRSGGSLNVARASVSRTLRRLRLRGLVELENDYGYTLTQRLAVVNEDLAQHERDPEAAYRLAQEAGGFFPFDDAAEYLKWHRFDAEKRKRHCRIQRVRLTPQGFEMARRLTPRGREVNRPPWRSMRKALTAAKERERRQRLEVARGP